MCAGQPATTDPGRLVRGLLHSGPVTRCTQFAVVLLVLCASACDSSKPASPTAPVAPQSPVTTRLTGQVVATVTGEPLPDVRVRLAGLETATNSAGGFDFEWLNGESALRVLLTGPHIIDRSVIVSVASSRHTVLNAIPLAHGFDLGYYRRFVRRALDEPTTLLGLRRWTRAPRVYLRTVDEMGLPVDAQTLQQTEQALADEVMSWTGGQFRVAEVVRGTGTREGVEQWVTVKWPNPAVDGICGRAQVGLEGGWIELNYLNPNCACGPSRIGAGIVRHEFGHSMGFYHTNEPGDLMVATLSRSAACAGRPSAREQFHAAIAYSRPVGNTDPDSDPGTTIHRRALPPIVVVD